jgi:hypothetical protein
VDNLFRRISFEENTVFKKTIGINKRLVKMYLWDFPLNGLAVVGQHEVFGHALRASGFDGGIGSIYINLPRPYGEGGGGVYISLIKDLSLDKYILIGAGILKLILYILNVRKKVFKTRIC